jgi:hypothetical protein
VADFGGVADIHMAELMLLMFSVRQGVGARSKFASCRVLPRAGADMAATWLARVLFPTSDASQKLGRWVAHFSLSLLAYEMLNDHER